MAKASKLTPAKRLAELRRNAVKAQTRYRKRREAKIKAMKKRLVEMNERVAHLEAQLAARPGSKSN